jgi:hypothetical protein
LSTKSLFLKDYQHGNNTFANLGASGGFALRSQHKKVKKVTQLLNDGGCNDGDAPRPPTPQGLKRLPKTSPVDFFCLSHLFIARLL